MEFNANLHAGNNVLADEPQDDLLLWAQSYLEEKFSAVAPSSLNHGLQLLQETNLIEQPRTDDLVNAPRPYQTLEETFGVLLDYHSTIFGANSDDLISSLDFPCSISSPDPRTNDIGNTGLLPRIVGENQLEPAATSDSNTQSTDLAAVSKKSSRATFRGCPKILGKRKKLNTIPTDARLVFRHLEATKRAKTQGSRSYGKSCLGCWYAKRKCSERDTNGNCIHHREHSTLPTSLPWDRFCVQLNFSDDLNWSGLRRNPLEACDGISVLLFKHINEVHVDGPSATTSLDGLKPFPPLHGMIRWTQKGVLMREYRYQQGRKPEYGGLNPDIDRPDPDLNGLVIANKSLFVGTNYRNVDPVQCIKFAERGMKEFRSGSLSEEGGRSLLLLLLDILNNIIGNFVMHDPKFTTKKIYLDNNHIGVYKTVWMYIAILVSRLPFPNGKDSLRAFLSQRLTLEPGMAVDFHTVSLRYLFMVSVRGIIELNSSKSDFLTDMLEGPASYCTHVEILV